MRGLLGRRMPCQRVLEIVMAGFVLYLLAVATFQYEVSVGACSLRAARRSLSMHK